MIIYLIINDALADFINYAIKGTKEFSNFIPYNKLIKFDIVGILAILVPITIVYEWIKCILLDKNRKISIILLYGIAIFVIAFPISDKIHFFIATMPIIVLMLYECTNIINRLLKNEKDKIFIVIFLTVTIYTYITCSSLIRLYGYYSNKNNFSNLKYFENLLINKDLEKQIYKVEDYVFLQKNKVLILDSSAVIYMIPIDKYNKDYDMFNKGNFGENGEQRLINEIKDSTDIKYLVLNDKFIKNWQTPLEIIEYVKTNKTKIGEIELFDIYE